MSASVRDILSREGPVARALGGGYEAREEQLAMAEGVWEAMGARSHLLVEAGTGIGKSFAYLVPAILRCVLHGERVVVATNTIALQEQLVAKDVPLLRAALEAAGIVPAEEGEHGDDPGDERLGGGAGAHALRPVLVKGRGNYVSLRRLALTSQRQDKLFAEAAARRTLHMIEDWARRTEDGTLATLAQMERPGVWDRVRSDSGNCMGRKCRTYGTCFYQRARREMELGNLLICNHALYFADVALRVRDAGFLPAHQHVILDEAHGVEDAAAEHFGLTLSEGRVAHLLSMLHHARSGKGYLMQLGLLTGGAGGHEGVERALRLVAEAEDASRAFFDSLARLGRAAGSSGRIRHPGAVENALAPAMRSLALGLASLKEGIRSEQDRFELSAYAGRAAEIAEHSEVLVQQTLPGCAYWVEAGGEDEVRSRGGPRVAIACSPIEVGPLLKEWLFAKEHSVVLTSATLATGRRSRRAPVALVEDGWPPPEPGSARGAPAGAGPFWHIIERLGCEGAQTIQLGSPFDHASQVELYIERSMPRPAGAREEPAGRDGTYARRLCERILHHIDATDGGAFVLFTSFASLNGAAGVLRPQLEERGMQLLAQGRDGPRGVLLEKFRLDERAVLLGAASFWQGVDVRGRGLRNVIITRLPFEPPGRPLTEARLEAIAERGGDPFLEDSLPRAVLRFKQGFGRLIRSRTDRGRVVVLDPRILTASYGRRFLEALPEGVEVIGGGR